MNGQVIQLPTPEPCRIQVEKRPRDVQPSGGLAEPDWRSDMAEGTCSVEGCEKPLCNALRGWCAGHTKRWERYGDPRGRPNAPTDGERFWAKVAEGPVPSHRPDLGPCWLWTASVTRIGYGQFKAWGSMTIAHRWADRDVVGVIPGGLEIDHLCRVRRCVNPAHLEAVTRRENVRRCNEARAL